MLALSEFSDILSERYDVTDPVPRCRLVDPDRLRLLMERTSSGSSISVRELAAASGVSRGTIGDLLQGRTKTVKYQAAWSICRAIGVDLLVLWAPESRCAPVPTAPEPATVEPPEAVTA
jgi:transcriptional regulator with XRE-family HTH domain